MRTALLILFLPLLALAQPNFQLQTQIASAGVSAGSAWTPTTPGNLIGWYKPDSMGSNNLDLVRTNVDYSGNGNYFWETSFPPEYAAAAKNGLGAIHFSGTIMGHGLLPADTKPCTFFMVVKTPTSFGVYPSAFGPSGNGGATYSVTTLAHQALDSYSTSLVGLGSATLSTATWYIMAVTYDSSGNYAFYLNGASDGSGNNNLTFSATTSTMGCTEPGNAQQWGFANGYIGECGKYSKALSGSEINSLFSYLNGRWAVY